MTVRVRFAPSPTGYLHIGGARTALYNYCFAKSMGGTFILRIEDTDLERSKREYEQLQIQDLNWLGLDYDEGPEREQTQYGPYRQSERLEIYQKVALDLVDKGFAYYDFSTDAELEEMKERALKEGRLPHYDGKWKNPTAASEAAAKLAAGEKAAIRFRAPKKSYVLNDLVRGRVVFPEKMVGDFVIMRSSGLPVYNFCCVVDDAFMEISHVIRGEDHLSNTVRQLMIYEAIGKPVPQFAHLSLLINKDRQKLSKRDGATSLVHYTEQGYLPDAVINYLTLLGWSHPQEKDIFNLSELVDVFDIKRFSKAAAIYDLGKFQWVNGQHIKNMCNEEILKHVTDKNISTLSTRAQLEFVEIFKDQVHFFSDFGKLADEFVFHDQVKTSEKLQEVLGWESTRQIYQYLSQKLSKQDQAISVDSLKDWMNEIKKEYGVKGKALFLGFRVCLTGKDHGPELNVLLPITPVAKIQKRLDHIGKILEG